MQLGDLYYRKASLPSEEGFLESTYQISIHYQKSLKPLLTPTLKLWRKRSEVPEHSEGKERSSGEAFTD